MFFCVASALIFGASGGNMFLNLSLFLAVATLVPDLEILFLLVIPLKLKWVALISLLWPAYILFTGSFPVKMIVIMCLGNYLIFFGPSLIRRSRQNRQDSAAPGKVRRLRKTTLRHFTAAKPAASPKPRTPTGFPRGERRKRILHEASTQDIIQELRDVPRIANPSLLT